MRLTLLITWYWPLNAIVVSGKLFIIVVSWFICPCFSALLSLSSWVERIWLWVAVLLTVAQGCSLKSQDSLKKGHKARALTSLDKLFVGFDISVMTLIFGWLWWSTCNLDLTFSSLLGYIILLIVLFYSHCLNVYPPTVVKPFEIVSWGLRMKVVKELWTIILQPIKETEPVI